MKCATPQLSFQTQSWQSRVICFLMLLPNLAWATPVAAENPISKALQSDWSQVTVGVRSFSVAEQEYLNEQAKEKGKNTSEVTPPKPSELQYPVSVEVADVEAKEVLETHLPLIVQQQMNSEIDVEQIQFLVEDTAKDAKDMLDTLGYFNAKVNIKAVESAYVVQVELGERVLIQSVTMNLAGEVLDDERLGEYYANATENWTVKEGEPFLQDTWSESKSAAVSGLRRKQYPLAQMVQSEALVDLRDNSAKMSATIDSGEPVFFGALDININEISLDGNQFKTNQKPRYPESIIQKLASFQDGDIYDNDQIVEFQNALEQDSHYSSVLVIPQLTSLAKSQERPLKVPVTVMVQEVPRQKFDAGLNFDSEDGHGFRLGYEHYNVFNRGYVGTSFLAYNQYEQSFGIGLSHPRKVDGTYNLASLNYNNGKVQGVKTEAVSAGWWNVKEWDDGERRLGMEFHYDDSYIEDSIDFGVNYVTMLTASWRYNRVEDTKRPKNGYYAYGKVGATLGSVLSSSSMQMVRADAAYYFTPERKEYGTFVVRGKAGLINVSDEMNAPQSLLFRTGGATSVRGYDDESIGIQSYHDSVRGGKILGVIGLEYQYPITYKKQDYALAVFHDMGDVANKFDEFQFQHGTGIGARWFSSFAPIAFDLAYGHEDQKIRWYIGLGTSF